MTGDFVHNVHDAVSIHPTTK